MIKILVHDSPVLQLIQFVITIEDNTVMGLQFTEAEREMMTRAKDGVLTSSEILKILAMITEKVEQKEKEHAENRRLTNEL